MHRSFHPWARVPDVHSDDGGDEPAFADPGSAETLDTIEGRPSAPRPFVAYMSCVAAVVLLLIALPALASIGSGAVTTATVVIAGGILVWVLRARVAVLTIVGAVLLARVLLAFFTRHENPAGAPRPGPEKDRRQPV